MKQSEFWKTIWKDQYEIKKDIDLNEVENKIKWYYEKHKRKPNENSKDFILADGTSARRLASAFRRGFRGLDGGINFPTFVNQVLDLEEKRDINLEEVIVEIKKYYKETGKKPTTRTKEFFLPDGTSATALDLALRIGYRGLKGGSSLLDLVSESLGLRGRGQDIDLNEAKIEVLNYFKKYGKRPTKRCKNFLLSDGTSLENLDRFLKKKKNKENGSSLSEFINNILGVPQKENFDLGEIRTEIKKYYNKKSKKPTEHSEDFFLPDGTTARNLANSFRKGLRGLDGNISFPEFANQVLGLKEKKDLDVSMIIKELKKYHKKNKKYPNKRDASFFLADGTSATSLDQALRMGFRGLDGGSSLAKLIEEISGKPSHTNKMKLTESIIKKEIISFYMKNKQYPTQCSKESKPFGSTWVSIDLALRSGFRGLEGGSSLSKLVKEVIKDSN